jgi:cellulose biosynthesis protein BcsQ
MRPRNILTVTTLKGGTGKTTFVSNLAAALAARGKHVLVIDLDPSMGVTEALGQGFNSPALPLAYLLTDPEAGKIDKAIVPCELPEMYTDSESSARQLLQAKRVAKRTKDLDDRLWIAPASAGMAAANYALAIGQAGDDLALSRLLDGLSMPWDWVVIDTPGGECSGKLIQNALMACDKTISVVEPGAASLRTVPKLQGVVDNVDRSREAPIERLGFVINKVKKSTNLAEDMPEWLDHDNNKVLAIINDSVGFNYALSDGVPAVLQSPDSEAVAPYYQLVDQLIGEQAPKMAEAA